MVVRLAATAGGWDCSEAATLRVGLLATAFAVSGRGVAQRLSNANPIGLLARRPSQQWLEGSWVGLRWKVKRREQHKRRSHALPKAANERVPLGSSWIDQAGHAQSVPHCCAAQASGVALCSVLISSAAMPVLSRTCCAPCGNRLIEGRIARVLGCSAAGNQGLANAASGPGLPFIFRNAGAIEQEQCNKPRWDPQPPLCAFWCRAAVWAGASSGAHLLAALAARNQCHMHLQAQGMSQ